MLWLWLCLCSVPSPTLAQSLSSGALNLDRTATSYATLPAGTWFNGPFTIEAWVYVRSYENWSRLIDFANGPGSGNVVVALGSGVTGKPVLQTINTTGDVIGSVQSPVALPLATWTHLACTFDGTTGHLYLNGVETASGPMQAPLNVVRSNNYIGHSNYPSDSNANAIFDELRIWSVARSAVDIQAAMGRLLTGREPGLLAWFPLDDAAGTTARNVAQPALAAQLQATATFTNLTAPLLPPVPALGVFNPAVVLARPGAGMTVAALAGAPSGSAAHSIEAWIRPPSNPGPGRRWILALGSDAAAHRWVQNADGTLEIGMWDSSSPATLPPPTPGEWLHLAASYDGAVLQVFTNGVQAAATTMSFNLQGGLLTLGVGRAGEQNFTGSVDEVRVWSAARSSVDIRRGMTRRLSGGEAGLLGYWRLDEGAGTQASDLSGLGNTAVLNAAADWTSDGAPALRPANTSLLLGTTGFVDLDSHALSLGASFTEEAWVFASADIDAAPHGIFGYPPADPGGKINGVSIINRTALQALFGTGPQPLSCTTTNNVLTPGAWNHIASTRSGSTFNFYVNGVRVLSTNVPSAPTSIPLRYLGRADGFLRGSLAEVRIWNRARTPDQILSNAVQRVAGTETGLLGYWRLDEESGIVASDQSGQGRAGLLTGVTGWASGSPPLVAAAPPTLAGGALLFDGIDDFVRIDRPVIPTNGNFTVEAWVYAPTNSGSSHQILSQAPAGAASRFYFGIEASGNLSAGDDWPKTTAALPFGAWHHVALVRDTANTLVYVDGQLRSAKGSPLATPPAAPFTDLGQQAPGGGDLWIGGIDELRVWNVARTPSQIVSRMALLLSGNEPGLVAYWRMDDAGRTLTDLSGHGLSGRLTNGLARVSGSAPLSPGPVFGRVLAGDHGVAGVTVSLQPSPMTNATALAIPDLTTNRSPLFIPYGIPVHDLHVAVNLQHPRRGDVGLSLVAPDGTVVRLKTASTADAAANLVTSFPDQTLPVDSLSVLEGRTAAGLWQLVCSDQRSGGLGTLVAWSLSLGPVSRTTDVAGAYGVEGVGAGSVTVSPQAPGLGFSPSSALAQPGSTRVDFAVQDGVVTSSADSGAGSLRAALAAAPSGSTLRFAAELSGTTIHLTSGPLLIAKDVTLDASGVTAGIGIDGGGRVRVIQVAAGVVATLDSLTLSNGVASADASPHPSEGGGLCNEGILTLRRCTVTGNQAAVGGGIRNYGRLTLLQATLTGNRATLAAGGLGTSGDASVLQSTLAGNSAPTGPDLQVAPLQAPGPQVVLGNSIVQGLAATAPAAPPSGAQVLLAGNNLVETAPDVTFTGAGTVQFGSPLLGPLGHYGGPTPTLPPLPGSPALDAAQPDPAITSDQRGFQRPYGAAPDLGSVEVQEGQSLSVNFPGQAFPVTVRISLPGLYSTNLTTDARGKLNLLLPLDLSLPYSVTPSVPGYPGIRFVPSSVTNEAGEDLAFTLDPGSLSLSGQVTNSVPGPLTGVAGLTLEIARAAVTNATAVAIPDLGSVNSTLLVPDPGILASVHVDVDVIHDFRGDLTLTLMAPDGTTVRLKTSDPNDDLADVTTRYPDQTATVDDLGILAGHQAAGLWTLRIDDTQASDTGVLAYWALTLGRDRAVTGADGRYAFQNLPPATYDVTPLLPESEFTPLTQRVVTGSTNVNFGLVSRVLRGRVTVGASPFPGVPVVAGSRATTTLQDGGFVLAGVPPGTYVVAPSLDGHGFTPPSLSVAAGATNLLFSATAFPIQGRIVDIQGNGVPGIRVTAGGRAGVSDSTGRYMVSSVPPGNYTVVPTAAGNALSPGTRDVVLGNHALTGVDFQVTQSPPVIGTITNRVIAPRGTTGPIRVEVSDLETAAGFLQVSVVSSDPSVFGPAELTLEGSGSQRRLTVTDHHGIQASATLTVSVSDGTAVSTTQFTVRVDPGPSAGIGSALQLDGTGAHGVVGSSVIGAKGDFTVEAWTRVDRPAITPLTPATLLAQGGPDQTNGFHLGYDAQGLLRVGAAWKATGVPFPFGGWHHLAIVKDNTNTGVWIDGTNAALRGSPLPLPPRTGRFDIGSQAGGTAEFWPGTVDEIRVWRSARTADELRDGMTRRVTAAEDGLVALWHLDEVGGGVAADDSGSGLDAAISGGTRVRSPLVFDHYTISEKRGFTDHLWSRDEDLDSVQYRLVTLSALGKLTLVDPVLGTLRYEPQPGSTGIDRFSFTATDGWIESQVYPVTIRVLADTNPPSITQFPDLTVAEDTGLGPIPLLVGDRETPAEGLTVTVFSGNPDVLQASAVVIAGTGSNRTVSLTPVTNAFGTAPVSIVVSDGTQRATNAFVLTVTPVDDAPYFTSVPDRIVLRRGTPAAGLPIGVNDVDDDPGALSLSAAVDQALLVTSMGTGGTGGSRTLSVVPSSSRSGTASLTLTLRDAAGATARRSVPLIVNEPPVFALPGPGPVRLLRNTSQPVSLGLSDPETPLGSLQVTATASDPALFASVAVSNNTAVLVTPVRGAHGRGVITLTARDEYYTVTTNLDVEIVQGPLFEIVDLGPRLVTPTDVNNHSIVVGTGQERGLPTALFVKDGLLYQNGNNASFGTCEDCYYSNSFINEDDVIFGTAVIVGSNGPFRGQASLYEFPINTGHPAFDSGNDTDTFTPLSFLNSGASLVRVNGNSPGVFRVDQDWLKPWVQLSFDARAMNNQNLIVGASADGSQAVEALNETAPPVELGLFGGTTSEAVAVNDAGQVVCLAHGPVEAAFILNSDRTVTSLRQGFGSLPLQFDPGRVDINRVGQVVGTQAGVPLLWTDGASYPLAGQLIDDSAWQRLVTVAAINDRGEIAGSGISADGTRHGFLLSPRYVVGEPIDPPPGAIDPLTRRVFQPPTLEALDGTPADQLPALWLWSGLEQRLYFFREIQVRATWPTTSDPTLANPPAPVVTTLTARYPARPQVHIAGAPVDLTPVDPTSPFRTLGVSYASVGSTRFEGATSRLTITEPGWTVVRYLDMSGSAPGALPDPTTHTNHFQVIHTYNWNDPVVFTNNLPALVGTTVADPRGPAVSSQSPKSGWVVNPMAPHDAAGPDAAYHRETQTGSIIPVNVDHPGTNDDLVVVFYKRDAITRTLWPDLPVRFEIAWPTDTPLLVIANPEGSGPLPADQFPDKRVYVQPDPGLPGYNPNEEHAFLAPTRSGEGLFALRNDLNAVSHASESFALLKYRDPASAAGDWAMKAFRVVLTDATHGFAFRGEAGQQILPPYPLSILPLCPNAQILAGAPYTDHQGQLYALSGPMPGGPDPTIAIQYSYPLLPTFWYDLNGDGTQDAIPGVCIPWKAIPGAGSAPTPVVVTYEIHWPAAAPDLAVGETLLSAKHGLPGVRNWANARIAFDTLVTPGRDALTTTARLYDPLSTRSLAFSEVAGLNAGYTLPDAVHRERLSNGLEQFPDLPYVLRLRLRYDPVNHRLAWSGFTDETVAGEPLLLCNVMSLAERERIKQLSKDAGFQKLVDALYNLTRNPNRLDLDHNGLPDPQFLVGLATNQSGLLVTEQLGSGPKALTAGLPFPPTLAAPGRALAFDGRTSYVPLDRAVSNDFTIEFWLRADSSTGGTNDYQQGNGLVTYADTYASPRFGVTLGNGFLLFGVSGGNGENGIDTRGTIRAPMPAGRWTHVAATRRQSSGEVRLYVDGNLMALTNDTTATLTGNASLELGRIVNPENGRNETNYFKGSMDELRIWSSVRTQTELRENSVQALTGAEPGLVGYWNFDRGDYARDLTANRNDDRRYRDFANQGGSPPTADGVSFPVVTDGDLTAGVATRYITVVENDAPSLGGLPVTLHVIRVDGGPYRGDLKVILPDNVFDERLTLRHSSDFGGDPDRLEFDWWYHPDDSEFDPTRLPLIDPATGVIQDARGWIPFGTVAAGRNMITLGDGGETSLFTLQDNWFITRYRGYTLGTDKPWSPWVGDPASTADTRAAFAPGWIKRVTEGINPFEARTTNFHDNASVSYASMLIQAGRRYEGPIALNPSGANVNSFGLIEAYTTLLERGKQLSIDGLPPVDEEGANNALLFAASRIADLYMLLGNEAFADAQDPTVGFFADSLEFGTTATSIFAFENQLDSLLEEELALLRGRDDTSAGVGARPVYNRLLWNFTGGEGEVAYERVYNIGDLNLDGVINATDAAIMYPQGHGDAWGHYLTAATTYYNLLRHPRFTWVPRAETVLINGVGVRVDYLDERKFAVIAAAKARTGAEIVDLTYRSHYVDDPQGQYQGYKDTDLDRAWGVAEWARRAGQGAYFDWLTVNAILPSTDPNPAHTGIQKIDRQTVLETDEIASHHRNVQAKLDNADRGLNPLGLAKGVVPFDLDPSFLNPGNSIQGNGHFLQVYQRAVAELNNTVVMWDKANQLTEALRRQQDTVDDFTANVTDQERDYKNRLIEVFGYPYAGDIGPGKTYPSGYDGPDIYHYAYIPVTDLTGQAPTPRGLITGQFAPFPDGTNASAFYFSGDLSVTNGLPTGPFLQVNYPLANGDWAFSAPSDWGSRRAPGDLQLTLSDLLQEQTRLKQALKNYDALIRKIEDTSALLQSRVNLKNTTIRLLTDNRTKQVDLNNQIIATQDGQLALRRLADITTRTADLLAEGVPKTSEILAFDLPAKVSGLAIKTGGLVLSEVLETVADVTEGQQNRFERAKEQTQLQTDIDVEVASQDYDIQSLAAELRELLRSEPPLRLETLNQGELVRQTFGRFQSALASGERLVNERTVFRQRTAGAAQQNRYKDMAFRIFRNEALQKYRAQFDLASRYVYLAASAYDYELNFLGTDNRSGRNFLTDIIRQRNLGVMVNGDPIAGRAGLSDSLARLKQNYSVLGPRFGLNNPQQETSRFSLRRELFRIRDGSTNQWRRLLQDARVPDLWQVPEFRRYCRAFAPESAGPQPGIVLHFPTTITSGLNFFGQALGGGDGAYDPSLFSTKINAIGIWFSGYNASGLAIAPRVYLFPAGMDVLRSPTGNTLATREWRVVDQALPEPFPIGASALTDPSWIPINDSLSEPFAQIRHYASIRAYHDSGVYQDTQTTRSTRLIGRSVWNTDWVFILPGSTLLNDPNQGLDTFIQSVSDILISLQSYSYPGD